MKLFKKPVRKFNRTTKPNVYVKRVLFNKYKHHFMIPVNKTKDSFGVYEATSKAGKKRFALSKALTKNHRISGKTTYIQRQYRRRPKSEFVKPKDRSTKITAKDFKAIKELHKSKYKNKPEKFVRLSN